MSDRLVLAELWERVSAAGNPYFVGFMGLNRLVLLREGEREHPKRPGEFVTVWNLIVEPREAQEPALARRHRLARELQRSPPRALPAPAADDELQPDTTEDIGT